jgi:NAD(P) transhydrogenase
VDATELVGSERRMKIRQLWKRLFPALKSEAEVLQAKESRDRLAANNIDIFVASAEFSNKENTLTQLKNEENSIVRISRSNECMELETKYVCIATGSRPNRPSSLSNGVIIPWTTGRVVCSTEIVNLPALPNSIVIYGGGVIAVEYATVFAKLGVGVTLFGNEENFLPFVEKELRDSLRTNMKNNHVLFVEDDIEEIAVDRHIQGDTDVRVSFSSKYNKDGKVYSKKRTLKVDMLLYSAGRDMNSDNLGLENMDVELGKYGRIMVDKTFKTSSKISSIYAVGDVIGPPMLASSAQAQARRLAELLFATRPSIAIENKDNDLDVEVDDFFSTVDSESKDGDTLFGDLTGDKVNDAPLTLWSIPEVSSVGVSYESIVRSGLRVDDIIQGYAYFRDSARGRLSGTNDGYLKVVCKPYKDSHVIVGVHIFGEGANELIQLGALLVHSKTTVQTVSKTPFAAVTLTGLFQAACDDCLRQIQASRKDEDAQ